MSARYSLALLLSHAQSLSCSSGTKRRDAKENGVKTLPNCCYCFCFVLFLFDICEQNVLPNRYGAGQRRAAVFSKFDSSAAEHFFRFFINSTPLSLLLLLLSFSPCTFCIFVYHTACLSLMRRLSCVFT